ncbi:hypothetical protein DSECCO2_638220 [anaerobic digester metagenome]
MLDDSAVLYLLVLGNESFRSSLLIFRLGYGSGDDSDVEAAGLELGELIAGS